MNADVDVISLLHGILDSLGGIEHINHIIELSLAAVSIFIFAKITSRRLIDV